MEHPSHDSAPAEHEHEHEHEEHPGGFMRFFYVFVALLVLTAISFAAGSSEAIMSTPAVGWTIMMAVSCAKALLVMLFFMHLIWEANWKYVLTIPASIMSIFLLLMLFPDIKGRTRHYSEERWQHAAKVEPRPAELDEHHPAAPHEPEKAETEAKHP